MKNLTIVENRINHTIQIVYGQEISFDQNAKGRAINCNGVWGRVSNEGKVILSVRYNPNVWKGDNSRTTIKLWVARQLEIFQAMQPKQIEDYII